MNKLKVLLKKYRYIVGLFTLVVLLLIPFLLKGIDKKYEPYPSIILPSGEWLAKKSNGNYSFVTYSIYGYDSTSNNLIKLNNRTFFDPISPTYIYGLTAINFGLKNGERPFLNRLFVDTTIRDTIAYRKESYRWLKRKLKEQHCRQDTLIIKIFNSEINNTRSKIVKTSLLEQKSINIPQR